MTRTIIVLLSKGQQAHQIYWVDHRGGRLADDQVRSLRTKISDTVDQEMYLDQDGTFDKAMEGLLPFEVVCFRPGVTDNPAKSLHELLAADIPKLEVHSGVLKTGKKANFNPLIQRRLQLHKKEDLAALTDISFNVGVHGESKVSEYEIIGVPDEALAALSKKNCWALSLSEMKAIQTHFKAKGRNPTDVEIEMIAQTWSEHCKHKIFNAAIDYQDADQKVEIKSLFKEYIKKPTYDLNKEWTVSVFDDNAGVVRFSDEMDVCIKVETHNSPSALDPYGGALTGILGVNRDIMGTGLGAKPIGNTNVFCVGMPDETQLPEGLLHPNEILKGIHRGVMDGGNKSGIPTVNGAIYFDESYSGKPLVYCGTVGVLPREIQGKSACHKGQRPGDFVVMVGGAVGIDGIHGATASSLVMDKDTTLGMVQIGDPFSQKRMLDFLMTARDRLLYSSLTDNGAGGLSSSVGEMAQATGGAVLDLETVPLKYPGLAPWQVLVSESQERMTLSVPAASWKELEELASLYQVSVTKVGEFTNDGRFTCRYKGKTVCSLELEFLHDGLPKMELTARWDEREHTAWRPSVKKDIDSGDHERLLAGLLSHPSLASKEKWVRQYDHEVQGGTVVKPFEGMKTTAPNDAGVLWYGAYGGKGTEGISVASGLCPHFSIDDTRLMSQLAVDEAVRNLICHGTDPDKIALVDNFCWPDPTPSAKNPDAEFKLAQLVRSCMGLREMVETYRMPLVSGKDSMKNDYHGETVKISVLPTLLVTAIGHVPDVTCLPKSHASKGSLLYRIGLPDYEKYFGHFLHGLTALPRENRRDFDWSAIRRLYQKLFKAHQSGLLASVHDVSEGGMLAALFETLLLEKGGIDLGERGLPWLYSELPGHFAVSISAASKNSFEGLFAPGECELLGEVSVSGIITVGQARLSISEMEKHWRKA